MTPVTPWILASERLPDTPRPVLGWVDDSVDAESVQDVWPAVVRWNPAGKGWEYLRDFGDWAPLQNAWGPPHRVPYWADLPPGQAPRVYQS